MNSRYLAPVFALMLTACASVPPDANKLAQLPQLRYGDTLPADGNYVLHYPAHTPLNVSTQVKGSLFEVAANSSLQIKLNRDVYVYRQFASLDKQNWQPANKLINSSIGINIPAVEPHNAAEIQLNMDLK